MRKVTSKEYIKEKQNEFMKACISILTDLAPELSYSAMKSIVVRIAAVKIEMDNQYAKDLLDDVEALFKEVN